MSAHDSAESTETALADPSAWEAAGEATESWSATRWLASLGTTADLATALFGDDVPGDQLGAAQALGAALSTKKALAEHLRNGGACVPAPGVKHGGCGS